jgi:hypothetical protein
MFRRPLTWVIIGVVVAGTAFGLYWFAPWKLFTTTTVHDTVSSPAPVASPSAGASTTAGATSAAAPAGPVVLAQGTFVSHDHSTTGTARIVRGPDGSRRLELVGLATSDGPDVRVWLTDAAPKPVKYLELGKLKGNRGDQVYPIPAEADLSPYRHVSIWCARFSVSFGAAQLDQPASG